MNSFYFVSIKWRLWYVVKATSSRPLFTNVRTYMNKWTTKRTFSFATPDLKLKASMIHLKIAWQILNKITVFRFFYAKSALNQIYNKMTVVSMIMILIIVMLIITIIIITMMGDDVDPYEPCSFRTYEIMTLLNFIFFVGS